MLCIQCFSLHPRTWYFLSVLSAKITPASVSCFFTSVHICDGAMAAFANEKHEASTNAGMAGRETDRAIGTGGLTTGRDAAATVGIDSSLACAAGGAG